jgi:hypothetical protein
MYSSKQLQELDNEYFQHIFEDGEETMDEEEFRHHLATFLFDSDGYGREKIKKLFSDIYVKVLEDYIDGNHDT